MGVSSGGRHPGAARQGCEQGWISHARRTGSRPPTRVKRSRCVISISGASPRIAAACGPEERRLESMMRMMMTTMGFQIFCFPGNPPPFPCSSTPCDHGDLEAFQAETRLWEEGWLPLCLFAESPLLLNVLLLYIYIFLSSSQTHLLRVYFPSRAGGGSKWFDPESGRGCN